MDEKGIIEQIEKIENELNKLSKKFGLKYNFFTFDKYSLKDNIDFTEVRIAVSKNIR